MTARNPRRMIGQLDGIFIERSLRTERDSRFEWTESPLIVFSCYAEKVFQSLWTTLIPARIEISIKLNRWDQNIGLQSQFIVLR
jgi:hypothetical protein